MDLRRLITVYERPLQVGGARGAGGRARAAGDGTLQPTGVFVTPQSLVTFPVASAAVTIIWKVLGQISTGVGTSALAALVISFVIGLFIYFAGLNQQATSQEKVVQFGIAILNSFWLAASALGLNEVTDLPGA
jgi:hypothetical protein